MAGEASIVMESSESAYEVLHVAETIRGGIAAYLKVIVPLQVDRYGAGRVAVIVPTSQLADLEVLSGADVRGFTQSRSRIISAWRAAREMRRLLRIKGVHLVHLHSTFAGMICRLFLWRRPPNLRVVYCPHGWAFVRKGRTRSLACSIERILSRFCDVIVCVSQSERDAALAAGIVTDKLVVISNGLPDQPKSSHATGELWSSSVMRLLFVGRLDRQKGFDFLLAVLAKVKRPVQVHVFGDSVLSDGPVNGHFDFIEMHGWVASSEIEPYLMTCDAVVIPSRWEGLPFTALEAMRGGKAVIASRVGGLSEVVEDGVTGTLLPPDDLRVWTRVIEGLDYKTLALMGELGRQRYLRYFTAKQMERNLAQCYLQCST